MRLAVITSHPVQYQAPLFRELARRLELTVFFAHRATSQDQAELSDSELQLTQVPSSTTCTVPGRKPLFGR